MLLPLKPVKALDHRQWVHLSCIAEASVERYRRSLPPGMEMEDLKQDVVLQIPKLIVRCPAHMEPDYYMYCRASFEVRRILHRQRTVTANHPTRTPAFDIEVPYEDDRPEAIDTNEQLRFSMAELTPLTQTLLLLVYEDCTYAEIAERLRWSEKTVKFIVDRATGLLGIPGPTELAFLESERIKNMLVAGEPLQAIVKIVGCDREKVSRVKSWLLANRQMFRDKRRAA